MIRKSPTKKTAQFSLNFVPLRELVETLDEQNEESLSGGGVFQERVRLYSEAEGKISGTLLLGL